MNNKPKVTKAEKDLKLQFIQNMKSDTKCNFCQYQCGNRCLFNDFNSEGGEWKNKPAACAEAIKRMVDILKA